MKDPEGDQHRKLTLGSKKFERVNHADVEAASPPVDVRAILRENLARADRFQPPLVERKRRQSHRLRDYVLVMVLTNGLLLELVAIFPKHPLIYVPALAGVVLFSIGATWVMWVVMDRDQFTALDAANVEPNQSSQHNAGNRPSSEVSSVSETPSSLGPRG